MRPPPLGLVEPSSEYKVRHVIMLRLDSPAYMSSPRFQERTQPVFPPLPEIVELLLAPEFAVDGVIGDLTASASTAGAVAGTPAIPRVREASPCFPVADIGGGLVVFACSAGWGGWYCRHPWC